MSRWIDADELGASVIKNTVFDKGDVIKLIEDAPSIDIVRCGECSKHNTHRCHMAFDLIATENDDFCSYGCREEKEGE